MMKALWREYYDQGFLLLTCAGSFRSTTPIVLFESPAGLYATSSNNPPVVSSVAWRLRDIIGRCPESRGHPGIDDH